MKIKKILMIFAIIFFCFSLANATTGLESQHKLVLYTYAFLTILGILALVLAVIHYNMPLFFLGVFLLIFIGLIVFAGYDIVNDWNVTTINATNSTGQMIANYEINWTNITTQENVLGDNQNINYAVALILMSAGLVGFFAFFREIYTERQIKKEGDDMI